jgi:dipeptide/tripeptide permease
MPSVHTGRGMGLIVVGAALALLTAFGLWRRLRPAVPVAVLAAAGALIGAGGLLVQRRAGAADWAVALALMAALAPLHCRILFGRPGRRLGRGVVAEDPGAA